MKPMETTTGATRKTGHNKMRDWPRVILLCILGYEAAGCLLGGSFLAAQPDGRLMGMPVEILHGIFRNFLVPGIVLFALGILNTIAFIRVLGRKPDAWFFTGIALGGLLIWFWVEIAILEELHWLHAMWGLPVVAGAWLGVAVFSSKQSLHKALLLCGILSSVLYAAICVIVPMQWPQYSSLSQTVSELSAINAPTRVLWLVLSAPYTLLVIAFAWGVWKSAADNRRLHVAGTLLISYGALGILWPFAPMHLREALAAGGNSSSDTMHLTLGAVTELLFLAALVLTAFSLGKYFKLYSLVTFFALMAFGLLTFLDAPKVSLNQPTPYIGLWERINIGLFLLWMIVLAVALLKKKAVTAPGQLR